MDAKLSAAPNRKFEEFEPDAEWVYEDVADTLILYLPGFKKEQLRVQMGRTRSLIISGERQVEDKLWIRFKKEFTMSTNCDADKISAKFETGILYIIQPKLITPARKQVEKKPTSEAPENQKPKDESQRQSFESKQEAGLKYSSVPDRTKRTNKKTDWFDTGKEVHANVPEAEPKPKGNDGKSNESMDSKNVSENISKREVNPDNVPEKILEKEKFDETDEDQNVSKNTSEKYNWGFSSEEVMKTDGDSSRNGVNSGNARLEDYRCFSRDLKTKAKITRRIMNMVLIILLALVLGMYFKNLIRPLKKDTEGGL